MKKRSLALTLIVGLYIIFRLLIVSSQRDFIFDYNEFFSGTIAMALIEGQSLPLKYCLPDDHSYGSIVNGILMVPFYLLFGPSTASAKMVSMLISLGVLVFWYLLLNKFFNQRVAIITSLLFILSPNAYTRATILSIGSHPESNLFTAIIVFILYLIFFDNRKRNIYFIILGIISGFASFYSYICILVLLLLIIFWFAFDKRFILKPQFYLFLIFFLIGFSPRFYFLSAYKSAFESIVVFLRNALSWDKVSFVHIIVKTKTFFLKDLPSLFILEHMPDFVGRIYYAFLLTSFVFLFKKRPISKESLLVAFPIIFSLGYTLSSYAIWPKNEGYIVPLYPFIFVIIGITVERAIFLQKMSFLKILSVTIFIFFILAGLYENLSLVSFNSIGHGFICKGYSYRFFGERLGKQNDKMLEIIKNIDFSERQYFLEGLGWRIARIDRLDREKNILYDDFIDNIIKRFSLTEQDKLHYYIRVGKGVGTSHRLIFIS